MTIISPITTYFRGKAEAKSLVSAKEKPALIEPNLKTDAVDRFDDSLRPVTLYAKIRKMPDGDLKLFINLGDPDDSAQDIPYKPTFLKESVGASFIVHDLLYHVLTSSSFSALSNPGGEMLHGRAGGLVMRKERIPKGAMDYVALLNRLANKKNSYGSMHGESESSLNVLLNMFESMTDSGGELILPFTIYPPDRSYSSFDFHSKQLLTT